MSKETWERIWSVVQLVAALAGGGVCVSVAFGPAPTPPAPVPAPAAPVREVYRPQGTRPAVPPCAPAAPQPLRTGSCDR